MFKTLVVLMITLDVSTFVFFTQREVRKHSQYCENGVFCYNF